MSENQDLDPENGSETPEKTPVQEPRTVTSSAPGKARAERQPAAIEQPAPVKPAGEKPAGEKPAAEKPRPKRKHPVQGKRPARRNGPDSSKHGPRKTGNRNKGIVVGVLSAVVLLAAGTGMVSAASMVSGPSGSKTLDLSMVDVPAGRATAVCPAPPRLPEGTPTGIDTQFNPVSLSAKSFLDAVVLSDSAGSVPGSGLASLEGSVIADISKPSVVQTPVAGPPVLSAGVVVQRPVGEAIVVGADPIGGQKAAVAALMSYAANDGDLRGVAAASCQQPGNDAWLLGANTSLGRTAVLNISNASSTPATVNLDLFGARGQVHAADSRGLLVSPGSTRSVNLAGLAPNEGQLSVHLRSSGGPVAASIQQSVLRGLTAGGVELITPGTVAADSQVMTGVDIQDPAAVKSLAEKSGFADAVPALQITVPGSADAVVDVRLFGPNGKRALPGGGAVTAKAGSVTEVPLTGVPAGMYTVSATSDVPFAASARVTRGLKAEEPVDFAWSPAAVRLGSQHVVSVPQGGTRFLSFGVPAGRATVSYTPITVDGKVHKTEKVDIAGGTTAVLGIPEKSDGAAVSGYIVSAAGDAAYGALVLGQSDQSGVSVLAIQDGAAGHEKVQVTLGY